MAQVDGSRRRVVGTAPRDEPDGKNLGTAERLFAAFERVYVINLPVRSDRRQDIAGQLARIGLGFAHPRVRLFDAIRPEDPGPFPGVGVRGCFLSHLAVLREAAHGGLGAFLLLEDDVDFAPDIAARLGPLCAELAGTDWAVFYGGYAESPGGAPIAGARRLLEVDPACGILLAHCVGFRGPAIREAADYLELILGRPAGDPAGGPMHVDGAYSWYRRAHPGRRTVAAVPPVATQRPSPSDIAARIWFDRIVLFRPALLWLRTLKRRFAVR